MAADRPPTIRVLYAEDSASDADLTTKYFEATAPEFEIEIVGSGEECLERVREARPDVLLLDNHLPDMDGVDVLQRLDGQGTHVPVVVTTSAGDEMVAVQVFRLGAVDYVPKDGDYLTRLPGILRHAVTEARTRPRQPGGGLRSRSVLYVEHDPADIDLTVTRLRETAPHLRVEVVTSASVALTLLEYGEIDLVLADLRLADLDAVELLRETKRRGHDVPFIVITGGGDEHSAVEALKLGVHDYIVKRDDYLTRLPHAIDHVIDRHQLVRANRELQRELEERYRAQRTTAHTLALIESLQQHAPVGIAFMDCDCRFQRVNHELAAISGVSRADHAGKTLPEVLPGLAEQLVALCQRARDGESASRIEISGITPASPGEERYFNVSLYPIRGGDQEVIGIGLVVVEITERKRAEAALREHAALMEDLARQKDEFLAMLSHELRNPLAPIRTALELLDRSGATNDVSRQAHDVIGRQITHMVRLLDDLLDVARITRGRVSLAKEAVDVGRVVADAVDTARPLLEARQQRLETSASSEPLLVQGDLTRLVQVLVNLLHNAAKFSEPGATIRLSTNREDDWAVLRVADTGAGIPARLLPKIFDLFTQDERALDRSQGGLGIGLTLVKRITELHGGTVEAFSAGRGRGSTFTVRLPLHVSAGETVAPPALERTRPSRPLRCLVVEDNIDAARMLEMALTLEGHDVALAFDGPAAVTMAAAFRPDAIVLDIGLPGKNGYDAAHEIRQIPGLADIVIVGVTGYGQATDYERSRRAGFDAHLVKPVEVETLLNALATARSDPPRDPRRQV